MYSKKMGLSFQLLLLLAALLTGSCRNSGEAPSGASLDSVAAQPSVPLRVRTGAERLLEEKLVLLKDKRVGIVTNHTGLVYEDVHLVDTLLGLGVQVKKVFAPEHGFRGAADAGAHIEDGVDPQTGLPILSLYGKTRKPTPEMLAGLDLIIFDIQDVGTRYYTYISTMSYVMEACADQGITFVVLDRPNPNGWYVDGPMMEPAYASFIGLHQVPVTHGMTAGEYALMANGEGWLGEDRRVDLTVVEMEGYDHSMGWEETGLAWVAPSPNLGSEYAAYLYPGICWFEPTPVSIGRGTHEAFTMIGAPWFGGNDPAAARQAPDTLEGLLLLPFTFTPVSLPGKSTYPKQQDKLCKGYRFQGRVGGKALFIASIELFAQFYRAHQQNGPKEKFFFDGFEKWPGYAGFREQIKSGQSAEEIYNSWQPATDKFRVVRKRYLLYEE